MNESRYALATPVGLNQIDLSRDEREAWNLIGRPWFQRCRLCVSDAFIGG